MQVVKVELKIEMDDDAKGFVLVPTNNLESINGPYGVSTSPVVSCNWNCRNGVQLRGTFTQEPDSEPT